MNATPPNASMPPATPLAAPTLSRRRLLRAAGLALLATPLAGCSAVRDLTGLSLTAPPAASATPQLAGPDRQYLRGPRQRQRAGRRGL